MFAVLASVMAANIWCGFDIYRISTRRDRIKKDYSQINSIRYGLLSVDAWELRLQGILQDRIGDFKLSRAQKDVLRVELSKSLNELITAADSMMRKHQSTLSGKMRNLAIKAFVDIEDIRKQVPVYAQAIIKELQRPSRTRKFKEIAQSGFDKFAAKSHDAPEDLAYHRELLARYQAASIEDFNRVARHKIASLESDINAYAAFMLNSALIFLLAWWLAREKRELHGGLFSLSAAYASVLLAAGLALPMLDLDARIKSVDFLLWGERLEFRDQILFYRSKSILQVVEVLFDTGKSDSIVVGVLLLLFSVLFPVAKLAAMEVCVMGGEAIRKRGLVDYFAFRSGKWSMADVTVVAIFIAYIGFKGILNSQLDKLNIQSAYVEIIATNETALQPGYILFTAFVLFGLALSGILKKMAPTTPS